MRRILSGALVALLVPAVAAAQPGPRRGAPQPRGEMPQIDVARALVANRAMLDLTDEQVSRLETLSRDTEQRRGALQTEIRALREKAELTDAERTRLREAAREAMEVARERQQGIRSVLTVEQSQRAGRLAAALGALGGGPGRAGLQGRGGRFGGFDRPGRGPGSDRPGFSPRRRIPDGPRGFRRPDGPQFRRGPGGEDPTA